MKTPVLIDWSLSAPPLGPYDPPESKRFKVSGEIIGSPKFADGTRITTSSLVRIDGLKVYTSNGSTYLLGAPAPAYVQWCKHNGCHVPTPEEPIKLL